MGPATEPQSKLDRWLILLRRGGLWLYLQLVILLLALFLGDKENWPTIAGIALLALLVNLVGWLVQEIRRLRHDQRSLISELVAAYRRPDEPVLTEPQNVMVCHAWDYYPWGLEKQQLAEECQMNDDDLEDALEALVKWDYLEFDNGRGPMGESNDPESYTITKKGRRYVENKWPKRGEGRRQKVHRAMRRRWRRGAKSG